MIKIQRIYTQNEEDGYRILVDRFWPRGITKKGTVIDLWMKEAAPSKALRKWFNHDPEKFDEFRNKYRSELLVNPEIKNLLNLEKEHKTIILLYGAKDEMHNQAVILKEYLEDMDTDI